MSLAVVVVAVVANRSPLSFVLMEALSRKPAATSPCPNPMLVKQFVEFDEFLVVERLLDRPLVDFHLSVKGLDRDVHKLVRRDGRLA